MLKKNGIGIGNSTMLFASGILIIPSLLAVLTARADSSVAATGWLTSVPVPGILCTNGTGQIYLKGNVHVMRIEAGDARAAGRAQAGMDLAYQPDGTALFNGAAYSEVGTWDAAGTNFSASGGVWSLTYRGVTQTNGSTQLSMSGYGIGGTIDGLRVEFSVTRAGTDPTIPYIMSGTIKPAPVNTRVVVDDFADNRFTWPDHGVGPNGQNTGTFFASETNQQLTIGGTWPATAPRIVHSTAWADVLHPWTVSAGQTIEARVDMIALSPTASGAALALWHTSGSAQAYFVVVGRNYVAIGKEDPGGLAMFRTAQAPIKDTNILLSLALTPVGADVVLTGKVLNKDNGAVIAQVVATDTPAPDPTVSATELAGLNGGRVWEDIITDPIGLPYTNGAAPLVLVYQQSDVAPLTATATFDNLELRTYEVPQVAIERAVRLMVPAPATGSWMMESATTVEGPWLPFQETAIPGVQRLTLPANDMMKFYRVVPAP